MRRQSLLVVITIALASCSTEEKVIEEVYYEDVDLGYEVDDFAWDDVEGEQDDTHLTRTQTAKVKIEGQAEHQVRVTQYDYYADVDDPKSGTQTLEIEDLTTGNFRAFTFAPQLSAILLESDEKDILVIKNPDGSYTVENRAVDFDEEDPEDVEGLPAANGRAAVMLLEANPIFADASPHGFILAHAMAQKSTPWTSLMKSLVGPQPPAAAALKAEPGAVCERFQDFCDCAACVKLNELETCKRCPQ